MATNQEVAAWLQANPTATDAQIAQAAASAGVSQQQLAQVTGLSLQDVQQRAGDVLAQQILGQGLTDKWSGEGFGSAEKNAADMAKILSNIGITDINQFGKIKVAADAEVVPVYSYVNKDLGGDNGVQLVQELTGYKDAQGNPVDSSLVTENKYTGGDNVYTSYSAPIGTQEVFGNKLTGEAVPNTYGERQTGDAFGGTYAGKGNTGYRVQFKDDGTPVFYTSEQSSNTLAGLLDNPILNLAANVAAASFGGPLGSAALQLAQGNDLGDAAKAALLTYAGGELKDYVNGATQTDSIYSLANGTPNLDYMGGGQGLTSTNAANLASMGGGQGLTLLAGVPAATVADAVNSFGNVGAANLGSMGGGQGITLNTPTGLLTEGGLINNSNVISQGGVNTGFDLPAFLDANVGVGIGTDLANIDTGVSSLTNGSTVGTGTTTGTGTGKDLTLKDALNIAKVGTTVAGLAAGANAVTQGNEATGYPILPIPADWQSPTYNQAFTPSAPIDFGTRDLLRGTQWENPALQQRGFNMNDLLATLNSPYASSMGNVIGNVNGAPVSLNDIISNIQGGYGQATAS